MKTTTVVHEKRGKENHVWVIILCPCIPLMPKDCFE